MARLSRYALAHIPHHVLQRGNNRGPIFFDERDRPKFLTFLKQAADDHGCDIHAWVLMPNHFHLLLTPSTPDGLSKCMQALGRRYVQYINLKHQRSGTLWEGRYRCVPIEAGPWLLRCMRYIERNPLRAKLVKNHTELAGFEWCSYGGHVGIEPDLLVTDHPEYIKQAKDEVERQELWERLIGTGLDEDRLKAIRNSVNKGWVLGSEAFQAEIEELSGRRVKPLPRGGARPGAGRPRKEPIETAPVTAKTEVKAEVVVATKAAEKPKPVKKKPAAKVVEVDQFDLFG